MTVVNSETLEPVRGRGDTKEGTKKCRVCDNEYHESNTECPSCRIRFSSSGSCEHNFVKVYESFYPLPSSTSRGMNVYMVCTKCAITKTINFEGV